MEACKGEIVEAQGLAESHLSKAFFVYRRVAECRVQNFYDELSKDDFQWSFTEGRSFRGFFHEDDVTRVECTLME